MCKLLNILDKLRLLFLANTSFSYTVLIILLCVCQALFSGYKGPRLFKGNFQVFFNYNNTPAKICRFSMWKKIFILFRFEFCCNYYNSNNLRSIYFDFFLVATFSSCSQIFQEVCQSEPLPSVSENLCNIGELWRIIVLGKFE